MKKISRFNFCAVLVSLGVLTGVTSAYAQQQEASKETRLTPKFGIKGGVNFSNLYVSNVQDEHLKLGVNAGFFAKLPMTKGISIQPELLYTSKGAKEKYNSLGQTGEYRFNLNYIETPLLVVFNLTHNFNLSAGGYTAYLVSANVKDLHSDGSITGVMDLNAGNFHRFDYGLAGGLGLDIGKVTLGARYNYGLQNIGRSGNLSGDLTKNSRNIVATLFIGFAF